MTTISAESILASRNMKSGDILHTLLLRYPRWIHSEFMTHRAMSRNAASSRAIPVKKLIQDVLDDPAEPLIWTQNEPGMQGYEELTGKSLEAAKAHWHAAKDFAIKRAESIYLCNAHKQIVNRLLEPFGHITVVCSATQWSNFLALRDHPAAEPHMQILAREVRKVLDNAVIEDLQPGDWHLPFIELDEFFANGMGNEEMIMLSAARCASTSYKTVEGFDMTLERAKAIYQKLISSDVLHASPFEHVAQADGRQSTGRWDHPEQHANFVGFRQFRKMLPGECQ